MKCNLECSYCLTGLHGGRDNTSSHPKLEDCFRAIDFMFEYADIYMDHKPKGLKYVVLNVYGGEGLYYPQITEVLERSRQVYQEKYHSKWNLTVTTTTNAIVTQKKMAEIIPLIDEFTCSYHPENLNKQKDLFKQNLLSIKSAGKRLKVIVMMHSDPTLFEDSQNMIKWCQENDIRYLPRQLDHMHGDTNWNYNVKQLEWFDGLYKKSSFGETKEIIPIKVEDKFDLSETGRTCCGGRQLCKDSDFKTRETYVHNKFPDWYCSVNEFFLFMKQVNGDIYVNKDCKMDFNGKVAPIGNLTDYRTLLDWTRQNLNEGTMPIIQCKKRKCLCGLCAPKAKDLDTFKNIMRKFHI